MQPNKSERNVHAKDLLTLASAITAASGSLALYGATHIDTLKGVLAFTIARAGDKVDGTVARLLDQESDAGAILDTGVDKMGIGLAVINGWRKEVIPRPAIAIIGGKSLASVGLTAIMAHNHPNESFRPTTAGKIAMGAESVALIAYAGAKALEKEMPELITQRKIAQGIGHAAIATTIVTGAVSLTQYAKRAFAR
jgi:phosphatidylglycerophosphate synthase